jgi:predicted amidohydrolase
MSQSPHAPAAGVPAAAATVVRAALVQLDFDPGEGYDERVARVLALVAAQRDCDLVVLPELWPNGGFTYDTWEATAEPLDGPLTKALAEAARTAGVVLHAGSFVERHAQPLDGRSLTNTSVVFSSDGERLALYRKIHLFGFSEGEPALMGSGDEVVVVDTPVGRMGLATCYDLRFAEMFRQLGDDGAQLVVVPAAWPASRVGHWRVLAQARAIENQYVVVALNTVGEQYGKAMGGHSMVVDARGEVLVEGAADVEQVLRVDIDLADVGAWRSQFPVLADRRL